MAIKLDKRKKPYLYKECGLKSVYLVGVYESTDGEVFIPNVNQLHKLLAQIVASQRDLLTPDQFRFLRTYTGLSRNDFGRLVDKSRETITRYETGAYPIPKSMDTLLRFLAFRDLGVDYELEDLFEAEPSRHKSAKVYLTPNKNDEWSQRVAF